MTFTSTGFFYFLPALLALSLVFGHRHRWLILLLGSYAFYAAWGLPHLIAALVVVTLSSYLCAIGMERRKNPAGRKALLWLGLGTSIVLLAVMRNYGALFPQYWYQSAFETISSSRPSVMLPFAAIGVSYYVLQAVSYLLDVCNGVTGAERHLGRYALHLAFFPKLLQGPIERAENLLPQLRDFPPFSFGNIAIGAQLFLWGMFQKVVVADRLAPFVNAVYGDVHHYQGVPLLIATYFFAAQLYFDFAGYTDMALGVARVFGVRLTQNFNSPYLSASVAEFWRRWHISFSSWLLDYIFRPLQLGLRDWRTWGTPAALAVTFLVSGLWHGATWCFVVWGLLHGLYLGISVLYRGWQKKLHRALGLVGSPLLRPLQVAVTFHLVCFAWIFFRASSLEDALYTVRHLVSGLPVTLIRLIEGQELKSLLYLGQGSGQFALVVCLLALGAGLRAFCRRVGGMSEGAVGDDLASPWLFTWMRTAVYAVMLYLVAFLGTTTQSFIYQQF